MLTTAPTIENLTLNIIEEIHIRSSLSATFAALLEQMGPSNEMPDCQALRTASTSKVPAFSTQAFQR